MLAAKLAQYLKDAEQGRQAIKSAPRLTKEETDRLSENIPPCIHVLARLTETTKGNTFNDIAMQLTAYAVSAGLTEGGISETLQAIYRELPVIKPGYAVKAIRELQSTVPHHGGER